MSIQHPAWLKRTRPCPFFSQGRCLFADSCNFLHDVKVKNALNQSLPSTGQPSFHPKPVFDPPSVVVNSASPPLVNLASTESLTNPAQDSSRYSGLLSVLSDVIGPPTEEASRTPLANSSGLRTTAYIPSGTPLEPESASSTPDLASPEARKNSEPSSVLPLDPDATPVCPSLQTESYFPQDDEPVAEFLPVSDGAESADEDPTSYFVEDTQAYVIGSEGSDDEDTNDEEEEFTVVSNRQSTFSSFTGVSLLASPRNSNIGDSFTHSVEGSTVDLLSPVQLSTKLRPFSIPSLSSGIKRGASIDSGYADGDNWVSPVPFPHSPPRGVCSPGPFPSHSCRASRSSPAPKGAVHLSSHYPIKGIKEVDYGLEDNEDIARTILDAYDELHSEEREDKAHDPSQVNLTVVTEDKAEDEGAISEVPVVLCGPHRCSPERLHPSGECDIDSSNQPSFVSDDGLSFKTALSTQPSHESLSDVSKVLPVEQDQRMRSGSDLTERVRPSQLPPSEPPDSDADADFTSRRSRAASDLTVKGKPSPATTRKGSPCTLKSPSLPSEWQGRLDPVQSLYDQYFDDGTPDNGSGLTCPTYTSAVPPDVSDVLEEPSQEVHLHSRDLTFQREYSPSLNDNPSNPNTYSPRSGAVLRPLMTGRKAFLRSSVTEFAPKTNLDGIKEVPSRRQSTRLQAKEIGSTMVPLGFRRHKPQSGLQAQPSRTNSLPLHSVLPMSQLRGTLRIRTDILQEDLPQGCSSATHVSSARSPLPVQSMSAPPTGELKQLRLSSIVNRRSSILSTHSSSITSSILSYHLFNSSNPQSPSVSSTSSFSRNSLLSPSCKQIPEQAHHTLRRPRSNSSVPQATDNVYFASHSFSTCDDSRSVSAPTQQSKSWRLSHYRAGSRNYAPVDNIHHLPKRTSILSLSYVVDEEQEPEDSGTVLYPIQSDHVDGVARPAPVIQPPVHAIATPKPTLLFAIASDDVNQVREVLESGEAGPNDSVGPQSALAFTLTNDKLAHKPEIVKALLAYGANPSALRNPTLNPAPRIQGADEPSAPPPETTLDGMDPATRYFISRADAAHTRQTSQLIYRSFFRPLTRVRYDVIGQDWALEQLFRVLSMHSQKLAVAPIVVLLCGPSGHGKSLLARKFGFLLNVPTHTVNMTTLRSTHDIWQSYSMSPYEEPSLCTLAEFLIENEGKRCAVVLDEIEKVEDEKTLWSLLMPWELGRCSLEAGKRHVDARNVIWLATSNVGHELVFEYHEKRAEPDSRMSREDYLELTALLRPRVSHCLGASLVSRVTTVLPFVPFTLDEKKAIAAEAIYAFAGEASVSPREVESLVMKALLSYHPSEALAHEISVKSSVDLEMYLLLHLATSTIHAIADSFAHHFLNAVELTVVARANDISNHINDARSSQPDQVCHHSLLLSLSFAVTATTVWLIVLMNPYVPTGLRAISTQLVAFTSTSKTSLPPSSPTSIAVFLLLFGLATLVVIICWIRRQRSTLKIAGKQTSQTAVAGDIEALAATHQITPVTPLPDVRWTPQIRSISGPVHDGSGSHRVRAALPPKRARSPPSESIKPSRVSVNSCPKSAPVYALSFVRYAKAAYPFKSPMSPTVTPQAVATSGMQAQSLRRSGHVSREYEILGTQVPSP